jgi:hypothetical protein
VTVVFCDVTGSTAIGQRLDPETLRRVMSRYFDAMSEAVEAHGGVEEKFIGDAVMAMFGIPRAHEDGALRAVRAADEMRARLTELNRALERDHGVSGLRIMEEQGPRRPNGFTAPIDAGLVAYQVMLDHPVIRLVDVFWLDEDQDGQRGIDYAL